MSVVIRKSGIYLQKWSAKKNDYVYKKVKDTDFFKLWRKQVALEDVTFSNIIDLVCIERGNIIQDLCNCNIFEFINDDFYANKPIDKDYVVEYIEVKKFYNIIDFGDGPEFQEETTCSGVITINGKQEFSGLSFTNWRDLKAAKIKINDTAQIQENHECIKTVSVCITLGEFLSALFDELTFFGTPSNREKHLNGLKNTLKTFDKQKFFTWDEVIKEIGE